MAVTVLISKSDTDRLDEVVLADVERLRSRVAGELGAGVAVAAAVGRTPVVPVRVQAAIANAAVDQTRERKPARSAVRGWSCGSDLLSGDEVLLRDECRMCRLRRRRRR